MRGQIVAALVVVFGSCQSLSLSYTTNKEIGSVISFVRIGWFLIWKRGVGCQNRLSALVSFVIVFDVILLTFFYSVSDTFACWVLMGVCCCGNHCVVCCCCKGVFLVAAPVFSEHFKAAPVFSDLFRACQARKLE